MIPSERKTFRYGPLGAQYYNVKCAIQVRPHLDKLLKNPAEILSFSAEKMGIKVGGLYNRINQSWLYLVDTLPDGDFEKYLELKNTYKVSIVKNNIIVKKFEKPMINGLESSSIIQGELDKMIEEANREKAEQLISTAKTKFNDYIDAAQVNDKLLLENQFLSDEDMEYFLNTVIMLPQFSMKTLKRSTLEIVKVS